MYLINIFNNDNYINNGFILFIIFPLHNPYITLTLPLHLPPYAFIFSLNNLFSIRVRILKLEILKCINLVDRIY